MVCISREGAEERLYTAKKFIITEIGSAFHEVMVQFEKSRDLAEKKRIGSDMTNIAIGHMIRGRFCTALATLLLDGLRPYRLEGLVTDDIWKVTVAFCNEGEKGNVHISLSSWASTCMYKYMYACTYNVPVFRGTGTPKFQPLLSSV